MKLILLFFRIFFNFIRDSTEKKTTEYNTKKYKTHKSWECRRERERGKTQEISHRKEQVWDEMTIVKSLNKHNEVLLISHERWMAELEFQWGENIQPHQKLNGSQLSSWLFLFIFSSFVNFILHRQLNLIDNPRVLVIDNSWTCFHVDVVVFFYVLIVQPTHKVHQTCNNRVLMFIIISLPRLQVCGFYKFFQYIFTLASHPSGKL